MDNINELLGNMSIEELAKLQAKIRRTISENKRAEEEAAKKVEEENNDTLEEKDNGSEVIEIPDEDIEVIDNPNDPRLGEVITDDPNNPNHPFKSLTREITPNTYHVTINPDEWTWDKFEEYWGHSREVYENNHQLRESSILSVSIDEDRMKIAAIMYAKEKDPDNFDEDSLKEDLNTYIDMIYEKACIKVIAKNLIGDFRFLLEEQPKYPISLMIIELPFLDTPASDFGL